MCDVERYCLLVKELGRLIQLSRYWLDVCISQQIQRKFQNSRRACTYSVFYMTILFHRAMSMLLELPFNKGSDKYIETLHIHISIYLYGITYLPYST